MVAGHSNPQVNKVDVRLLIQAITRKQHSLMLNLGAEQNDAGLLLIDQ